MSRSHLTTHVLDVTSGTPARGVAVELRDRDGTQLAAAVTDDDGRVGGLGPERLDSGVYQVVFATGDWFAARGQDTFYPSVQVHVVVDAEQPHYHVPLLLGPFAYSTYRGS